MGAPKRLRSTKDEGKLTSKQRKIAKHRAPAGKLHKEVEQQVDEHSEGEEAEFVANTKLTDYDSLLKKLGTQNVSVADALRRRQREEQGESDEDEDEEEEDDEEDSDPESIDELEENADDDDDDDDGNNIMENFLFLEIKKLEVGHD